MSSVFVHCGYIEERQQNTSDSLKVVRNLRVSAVCLSRCLWPHILQAESGRRGACMYRGRVPCVRDMARTLGQTGRLNVEEAR